MIHRWRDIPGYDGKYQANTEGEVRRVFPSGKTRKMHPWKKKYAKGSNRYVVKLTKDGKPKDEVLAQVIARTFMGPPPEGYVAYHKNGIQEDNYIQNIEYISKVELGRLQGPRNGKRKAVVKIDETGEIVDVYSSAREAGRKNFMSYQTIKDRCDGKVKSAFAPDGYAYAWEESPHSKSVKQAVKKILKEREVAQC